MSSQVFAHDLNEATLEETAKLAADAGGTVATRTGDVTSHDECFAAVAAAVETFGKLDVLGNVAGIARAEHFHEVPESAYRLMVGVNMDRFRQMADESRMYLFNKAGYKLDIFSKNG